MLGRIEQFRFYYVVNELIENASFEVSLQSNRSKQVHAMKTEYGKNKGENDMNGS